jgi:hypothetical protein
MSDDEVIINLDPGACRFKTKVSGRFEGDKVKIVLESDCPYVKKTGEALPDLSMTDIIQMPFSDNLVYLVTGKILKHSVCPVPMAILKVSEATMGLALKRDIKADYEKN